MSEDEVFSGVVTGEAFVIALLSSRTGWRGTAGELAVVFDDDVSETRRRLNRMVRSGLLRKGAGASYQIDTRQYESPEDADEMLRVLRVMCLMGLEQNGVPEARAFLDYYGPHPAPGPGEFARIARMGVPEE
jgi:hypothetical protein